MKSVFDRATQDELSARIQSVKEENPSRWGRMTAGQMVKHCIRCEELYLGKVRFKRVFLGRLFGRSSLKKLLSDDRPLQRNAPASPLLVVTEEVTDIERQKQRWIALVRSYETYEPKGYVHPYFGKMTKEQLGKFVYKHSDHHLRQFGC